MIDEYDFMDGVDSVDELKKALKKLNFWANSWAISTLEKHYNIKIVIFSKENYSRGARNNILQCGDIPTSIAEPKCKMCKIKLSEYQRTKKKEHPEDHVWVDTNDNKEINPTDYVMVSHTGNHYELITFNGEKSFKNLPDIVKNKIKEKCSKDGELLGAYSKIKDF